MTRLGCHAPRNGRSGPTTRDMSPTMGGQERSACLHQAAAADRARSSLEQPLRQLPARCHLGTAAAAYRPYFWNSQSLLSSGHTCRVLSHRLMLQV